MTKYDCWYCDGSGEIEIHSAEGNFIRNCGTCGGSGKTKVTITLEEYDNLKEKAYMYDGLCR